MLCETNNKGVIMVRRGYAGAVRLFLAFLVAALASACGGGGGSSGNGAAAASSAKAITSYSLLGVNGTINEANKTIVLMLPSGTNVTALSATFTTTGTGVKVGATPQVSGTTKNDFTAPVIYTVTAADGSTANYTVTVLVASATAKAITAFSIAGVSGTINELNKTITVVLPFGTSLTQAATFTTTGTKVTVGGITQVSGTTSNTFASPVLYTVTAGDLSTATYTVNVTVASNTAKALAAFSLAGVAGTIDETHKTIAVNLPSGINAASLVATFTTTGASVSVGGVAQTSGVSANNFTAPLVYTVTAADASTASYTVTVVVAPASAKAITAYALAGVAGVINETNKTISVTMPSGTNVTSLVATFTTTGVNVTVGGPTQYSGTTANNFTAPVTYTVIAADNSTVNYTVTVTVAPATAKAITAYSLAGAAGVINETNKTIAVTMPFGTNVSALAASFTTTGTGVAVGATAQVSGLTTNNFTAPVVYTVTAADASTVTYTVTVIVQPNTAKAITSFSVAGVAGTINETNKTILVNLPFGTSLTTLVPSFATTGTVMSVGGVAQISGFSANNFTGPLTYTVTAADASTVNYTVAVAAAPSSAKAITAFSLAGVAGTINEANKTIAVSMPSGTNAASLVASFTTSGTGVAVGGVSQTSGFSANNFTAPVVYTVTAADASTVSYTVTVTVAPATAKALTAFSLAGMSGTINEATKTIAVTMPFGTNVTGLVASFTTTGTGVAVGATTQLSGFTANNFTAPVSYTVTAADASTVAYTVTVTVAPNTAKAITAFALGGNPGVINNTSKTIAVGFPTGANLGALVATFSTTGTGITVGTTAQISGYSANNFTSPVTYTVKAADGSTVNYTVTVTTGASATIGGTLNGLAAANSLVLKDNGADNLTVAANGAFTFATPVNYGSGYSVSIGTLPLNQPCLVTNAAGTAWGTKVTNVNVTCGPAFVGAFSAGAGMATPESGHSSTLLQNGMVLVVGAAAERYDPVGATWGAAGTRAAVTTSFATALLPNGKVLVAGGSDANNNSVVTTALYDPVGNAWAAGPNLLTARSGATATVLANGTVLVVGGDKLVAGAASPRLASAEVYDPVANTWTAVGSLATARAYHTATLLPDGRVLVAGGQDINYLMIASAELYDPATKTWLPASSLASARAYHTATGLPDGRVLVAGGTGGGTGAWSYLASAEVYDPAADTWSTTGSLTVVRSMGHVAALMPTGKVLVAGGNSGTAALANAELYDPATGAWTATGSLATTRHFPAITVMQDGKAMVSGGLSGSTLGTYTTLSTTELYW